MSTFSALETSNLQVLQAIENLPDRDWEVPGIDGNLSVKEIVARLVGYERLIVDALQTVSGQQASPDLLHWARDPERYTFNELEAQRYATAQQVEDDFQDLQVQSNSLLELLPDEQLRERGTLPWYKPEASLADFLTQIIGSMQKLCTQIKTFRQNGARPA